jgi:hypothetical protein
MFALPTTNSLPRGATGGYYPPMRQTVGRQLSEVDVG